MVTIVPGPKKHRFYLQRSTQALKSRVLCTELSVAIALSTETINRTGNKP